jgi:Protein of unknown function (DUF1670)
MASRSEQSPSLLSSSSVVVTLIVAAKTPEMGLANSPSPAMRAASKIKEMIFCIIPSGEQVQDWLWALYRLLIALKQPQQAEAVSIARRDVPLGRSLKEEDITVRWTLNSPDDEAFAGKSKRRQHRLKRLLEEAERQGAAPTDDDLARGLGVSRRTILRDMQALSQVIPKPPTRKRKK